MVTLWQVNQKMILMLTASIMYWSLQQSAEESSPSSDAINTPDESPASSINGESSPSPALATTPDASPAHSINGESTPFPAAATTHDAAPAPAPSPSPWIETSVGGEVSSLTIDDATSDTVISSQVENE